MAVKYFVYDEEYGEVCTKLLTREQLNDFINSHQTYVLYYGDEEDSDFCKFDDFDELLEDIKLTFNYADDYPVKYSITQQLMSGFIIFCINEETGNIDKELY